MDLKIKPAELDMAYYKKEPKLIKVVLIFFLFLKEFYRKFS
jgi:hypothetical protein